MENRTIPELFNPSGESIPVTIEELSSICFDLESNEEVQIALLELVYLASDEMIRMNHDHKQHDYRTDILTFPYHDDGDAELEATLYCCPAQISEQAKEWNVPENEEFYRVFIHGLLHLCGYDDQTDVDRSRMKTREEFYLSRWRSKEPTNL